MDEIAEFAWKMITELRIEVREAQKIRAQIIGVKIAFVTASLGFVVGLEQGQSYDLIVVPALASIFFDYLIISYGISIKRIGYYSRTYLEPKLRSGLSSNDPSWPFDDPFWEEAMSLKPMRQHFAGLGNMGLTVAVLVPAILHLIVTRPFDEAWSFTLAALLLVLFGLDASFTYFFKYHPAGRLEWPPPKEEASANSK